MASILLLFLLPFLLTATPSSAVNVSAILNQLPNFTYMSTILLQSNITTDIISQNAVTIIAPEDKDFVGLDNMNPDIVKRVLSVHVILNYYDDAKIQAVGNKPVSLTTLFQASSQATGMLGLLNMQKTADGKIVLGSAAPGAAMDSYLVKSVVAKPNSVSVLQVSKFVIPPGIKEMTNNANATPHAPLATPPPVTPAPKASTTPIAPATPAPKASATPATSATPAPKASITPASTTPTTHPTPATPAPKSSATPATQTHAAPAPKVSTTPVSHAPMASTKPVAHAPEVSTPVTSAPRTSIPISKTAAKVDVPSASATANSPAAGNTPIASAPKAKETNAPTSNAPASADAPVAAKGPAVTVDGPITNAPSSVAEAPKSGAARMVVGAGLGMGIIMAVMLSL